jgi:hypothetical protein
MKVNVYSTKNRVHLFSLTFGNGRPIPRKGEKIIRDGKVYKVKGISHKFSESGKSGSIVISIYVKK